MPGSNGQTPAQGSAASLWPRQSVLLVRIQADIGSIRCASIDERERELLRQRTHGEFLGTLNRNWPITIITSADGKQYKILLSILKSSITGNVYRRSYDSCQRQNMQKDFMLGYLQHERVGVHFWHPTSCWIHMRSFIIVVICEFKLPPCYVNQNITTI